MTVVRVLDVRAYDEYAQARVELPSGDVLPVQFDGTPDDLARNVNARLAERQKFSAVRDTIQPGMEIDCGDASVVEPGTVERPVVLTDEQIAKAVYRANFAWLKRRILDESMGLPDPDPEHTTRARDEVMAARLAYPHFEECS